MVETTITISDAAPSAYPTIELVGIFDGLDGRGLAVVDIVYEDGRVSFVLVSIVCDVGGMASAIDSVPTVVVLVISAHVFKLFFYSETELCT